MDRGLRMHVREDVCHRAVERKPIVVEELRPARLLLEGHGGRGWVGVGAAR